MLKKYNLPFIIGEAVIFAIYSLLVFLLGDKSFYGTSSFITAYVFTIGFGLLNVVILFLSRLLEDTTKSINNILFLLIPEVIAFLFSLGFSLKILILRPETLKLVLFVYISLLIVYLAYFIIIFFVVSNTNKVEKHQRKKVNFIRFLVSDLEDAIDATDDKVTKELIEKLRDDVRFSDPMSDESLSGIEDNLSNLVEELKQHCREGKTESAATCVSQMSNLVKERNRKCRILK